MNTRANITKNCASHVYSMVRYWRNWWEMWAASRLRSEERCPKSISSNRLHQLIRRAYSSMQILTLEIARLCFFSLSLSFFLSISVMYDLTSFALWALVILYILYYIIINMNSNDNPPHIMQINIFSFISTIIMPVIAMLNRILDRQGRSHIIG